MSDQEQETLDYFDLIVECAKVLKQTKGEDVSDMRFWEIQVGKEWRNVYFYMSRGKAVRSLHHSNAVVRDTALRFAALSRMAAMAAWDLMGNVDGHEPEAGDVAKGFVEMAQQPTPKVR